MEHLIPSDWFAGAPMPVLLLVTLVSMAVLVRGADWLVDGASGLAYRLGLPKVVVGATIVSLGTTSPECAVSVMAAWAGESGLALGNAVGSIIADTGLIFGIGCLMARLPADRFILSRQGWVQFGAASLLVGICGFAYLHHGGAASIGRGVGVLLLGLLAGYLWISVRWSRQHPLGGEPAEAPAENGPSAVALLGWMIAGLALVIVSSHVLILSVSELAHQMHVPQVVIAATLVALGTSLPELVVGLTSIRKGHPEILVGNVIGADILNVLFVIGASAVAAPLPILDAGARFPAIFLWVHLPTMLLILISFRLFIVVASRAGHFRRWMGVPLLAIYVAYVVVQYAMS